METIRIIVYKNQQNPGSGKNVLINTNISGEDLLYECCKVLKDDYKLIFDERGKELSSAVGLHDGSSLYLSQGEDFQVAIDQLPSKEPVFVLLGAAGVGKSAITLRYIRNLFVSDYDPTIEDYYKHKERINGEMFGLSILDTAGMEDYEPLLDEWIDKKQAAFLVFSLEMPDSLSKVTHYYEKICLRYPKNRRPYVVLVGNKADLPRRVSMDEGEKVARELGCKYYEVSAATGTGIKELFNDTLIEIKKSRRQQKKPWYRRCFFL